jgi:protein N-terminal amidase
MCLSGYVFNSPTAILPYLEQPRIGPTSLLARSLAQRLQCHVIAGYPEATPSSTLLDNPSSSTSESATTDGEAQENKQDSGDCGPQGAMKALEGEGTGVGWNSAIVVGPHGDVVGNYRKTFRFETDKAWAREGERDLERVVLDIPHPRDLFYSRLLPQRCDVLKAGDGFSVFDLPEPIGRTTIGICMGMSRASKLH